MTTAAIHTRPDELLQQLIRFNTTNPPGHEAECVNYINTLLTEAGFETTILAKDDKRPNLIARLLGRGEAPPLLLQGHVDVVTTANQEWSRPPFEAEIHDGFIWGRGTLDMKGGVAMMITALLRAQANGLQPAGDIILCILSDEEVGGSYGAKFLVEEHPEQFEGVKYALGEFGGYNQLMAGKKFYPIQVAEKQICSMQATIRGAGGHGSFLNQGGTMAQLGRFLTTLDQNKLPVHILPVVREMFTRVAQKASFPQSFIIRQLLNPAMHDRFISLLGDSANTIGSLFRNTINATIVNGGNKINVIPSEIVV
ncbi:MAG: M20/M25/M40 family metallo-hydrolase, partial [Anaerolineales bacterium]|nr:M20/M25/M40 family metallo-hydrolase [Anaerolineales bacterium]